MPDLRTEDIDDQEIFSTGKWNNDEYSAADLDAMVEAYDKAGFKPPIKLGHSDAQKLLEGEEMPAAGWVENLRRAGDKLLCDFKKVPGKIADLIRAGSLRTKSAEIYWGYKGENGKEFPRVLKAVSLLGTSIPAVSNLNDIMALYEHIPGGPVHAFKDAGNEFRLYERDYQQSVPFGPVTDFLLTSRRKAKAGVDFTDLAALGSQCGGCKFYIENLNSCTLVEGFIEADDGCKLFEADSENYSKEDSDIHSYNIVKRGSKFCLIAKSTGKVLGCVTGDTEVWGPKVYRSTSRWYKGEIIELTLVTGEKLRITPNHPVLTLHGFVPAGLLNKDSKIVCASGCYREKFGNPNDYQVPTAIKDIAASFGEYAGVITRTVPVSSKDFHGDGKGSNICVVRTNSLIDRGDNAETNQAVENNNFIGRLRIRFPLSRQRASAQAIGSHFSAAIGSGHSVDDDLPVIVGEFPPEHLNRITARPEFDTGPLKMSNDTVLRNVESDRDLFSGESLGVHFNSGINIESLKFISMEGMAKSFKSFIERVGIDSKSAGDTIRRSAGQIRSDGINGDLSTGQSDSLLAASDCDIVVDENISDSSRMNIMNETQLAKGFASQVYLNQLVDIRRLPFAGHVYNLSTVSNYYIASSIVVHNCHSTKEDAVAQEGAIKASQAGYDDENKGAKTMRLTRDDVREICPSCADKMERTGITVLNFSSVDEAFEVFAFAGMKECMADAGMMKENPDIDERKKACQGMMDKKMSAIREKIDTYQKGGADMTTEELAAEREKMKKEMMAELTPEFEKKIAEAKAEGAKDAETRYAKSIEEQGAQIKKMEAEKRSTGIDNWIDSQKREGKIASVEEPRMKAFLISLEDGKALTYSQDGKEQSLSQSELFKDIVAKRPSLFKVLSRAGDPKIGEVLTYANAQEEVTAKVTAYQEEHKEKDYGKAMLAVLKADPELNERYMRLQQ